MKKRNTDLDVIAGLFIIWMTYIHFSNITKYEIPYAEYLNYFFFFFMPWFFYKSGMFHKKTSFNETVKKGFKRLIVPFFIFTIIGWIFDSIIITLEGKASVFSIFIKPIVQIIYLGSSGGNWPLWFLVSLFFVKIIVSYIDSSNSKFLYLVCGVITITIPFLMYYFKIEKFIYIANILNGLLFYWLGYKLKEKQYSNTIFICSLFLFIIITVFIPSFTDIHKNLLGKGYYYVWLFNSMCGIFIINNIAKRFHFNNHLLESIGKDSMSYYVTHWLFLSITHIIVLNILHIHNAHSTYFWTTTTLFVLIAPLINKILKKSKFSFIIGL